MIEDWITIPNDVETVTTTNMETADWIFISLADEPIPTVIHIY